MFINLVHFRAVRSGRDEHESEATFMAMHTSPERAAMWEKVEPLIEGRPEPGFFEVVEEARA